MGVFDASGIDIDCRRRRFDLPAAEEVTGNFFAALGIAPVFSDVPSSPPMISSGVGGVAAG